MSYMETEARKAERDSNWWEARRLWLLAGGDYGRENANACKTIAEAIDLGDRFRAKIAGVQEQLGSHRINIYQYTELVNTAHAEVYGS